MPRTAAIALSILLAVASIAGGQQARPRIAIVPLNPESVSRADAATCTALLEAALVKTQSFEVLEQNQANEILLAQERSLSDCTDERCAVEVGKLLAAEQIVLGSVSATGGRLFLTAKIIDVATGRNLKADSVDAPSVTELTGRVELLGYKLAGLTYQVAGEERIAQSFGEVFVDTSPTGAEVLLNGVPKGRSPLLIERVPAGRVVVEARSADLYARREAEVGGLALLRVSLELGRQEGNIFLRSRVAEGLRVFLDGKEMGALGAGLLEKVPAGAHDVALEGGGYHWAGSVMVELGKTVTVEASPREVGQIEYTLPAGAQAEVTGKDFRAVIRESGALLHLPVQEYAVRVTGADYDPLEARLAVVKGATAKLAPELKHTAAYERAEKLTQLRAQQDTLLLRRQTLRRPRRTLRALGWPALVAGAASLGLGGVSYYLGTQAYAEYVAATDTDSAVSARGEAQKYTILLNVGAIAGGLGAGAGILLVALAPSLRAVDSEIAEVDRAITALEGE